MASAKPSGGLTPAIALSKVAAAVPVPPIYREVRTAALDAYFSQRRRGKIAGRRALGCRQAKGDRSRIRKIPPNDS